MRKRYHAFFNINSETVEVWVDFGNETEQLVRTFKSTCRGISDMKEMGIEKEMEFCKWIVENSFIGNNFTYVGIVVS